MRIPFSGLASLALAMLAAALLAAPAQAQAQQASSQKPIAATLPRGAVIKFQPGMTAAQLRALPADTLIELHSGRTVRAAQLAATGDALKLVGERQRQLRALDLQMSRASGAPQLQWRGPQQLAETARLPAATVVQLQDGRRLSVADINKLQELAARTGLRQKLEARAGAQAAPLRGKPALVVRSAEDLRKVERLPADAIVATEDGKRARAGDIRDVLARRATAAPQLPGARR